MAGLLPKFTTRGQQDLRRSLYNPMNPRHIILSIREDYSKRLKKLNKSPVRNKKVRNMYKRLIASTYTAEENNWRTSKNSKLGRMVRDRRKLDKVAYKSMEKMHVRHKGVQYAIPVKKSTFGEIAKYGNMKTGFAMANIRTRGKHAEELRNFLE